MRVSDIKKLAKELKKNDRTKTYCQHLDDIVKSLGYPSWNHYCAIKKDKIS